MAKIKQALHAIFIGLIRLYQLLISPLLGPRCRFSPTCSEYAIQAIRLHGLVKGSWLAIRRIGKCHPGHPGGFDPVPGASEHQCASEQKDAPDTPKKTNKETK